MKQHKKLNYTMRENAHQQNALVLRTQSIQVCFAIAKAFFYCLFVSSASYFDIFRKWNTNMIFLEAIANKHYANDKVASRHHNWSMLFFLHSFISPWRIKFNVLLNTLHLLFCHSYAICELCYHKRFNVIRSERARAILFYVSISA